MGNVNTTTNMFQDERTPEDLWWNNPVNNETKAKLEPNLTDDNNERVERKKLLNKELDDFKRDLHTKHEEKRQLIIQKKQELINLRAELKLQKMINEDLQNKLSGSSNNRNNEDNNEYDRLEKILKENEEQKKLIEELKERVTKYEEVNEKNNELRVNLAKLQDELQSVNAEVLDFESERNEYKTHVTALKDVVKVTKEMLNIRENQIQELRQKMNIIEATLADREMTLQSETLRKEYERQLKNIRSLRALYEERERVDKREKQNMLAIIEETKKLLQDEQNKNQEQQSRIEELETETSSKYDTIKNLESQLGLSRAECKELQAEMGVINQLFSQILLGFNNSQDIDLDKLIRILEENHDLLSKIAINEESTEISTALPKTLLDLVNQMNRSPNDRQSSSNKLETIVEETDSQTQTLQLTSAEEIVQNLPKVWKVLIELLSHQCAPFNAIDESPNNEFCYKSVQTPKGPKLVLSVSKTFIRLKDLILEKKSLEKETNHLKHLNTHLEVRLQDQEKRLEMVSSELNKTWHVVGKMQRQHQQLHTHEKILRYELAQKRKLLNELKEELEYCREKWIQAREKNSTTEEQWKQLRKEFASRKPKQVDISSTESGYSDDKSSSDEEPAFENKVDLKLDATIREDKSIKDGPIECSERASVNNAEDADINLSISSIKNDNNHSSDTTDKTETVQSDKRQLIDEMPCTSSSSTTSTSDQTRFNLEEMLARREVRLKRMEEEGKELVTKVAKTTKRSVDICNKLENLHEIYRDDSNTNDNSDGVQSTSKSTKDVEDDETEQ